ncbi:MAG: iron donor protein CyaY [Gammaproteobacteria bacterium]|jgi:CyaY protein|nr:iron donor protein CyaY [Gammaproteobacteria bacterium]
MPLNSSAFHDLVDDVQQQIEDILDDSDLDLDIENSGGILTLVFTDGSQIILSRQEPLKQLWVAARQGGFHFDYDTDSQRWLCSNEQRSLGQWLATLCQQQSGEPVDFPGL